MKNIVVLLALVILVSSCGDDADEIAKIEFLQVDTHYGDGDANYKHFVFATSLDGAFLDLQPLKNGVTARLSAEIVPDKVNVTFVSIDKAVGIRNFSTYTAVAKGSHLIEGIDPASVVMPKVEPLVGIARLRVENYTGSLTPDVNFFVSNGYTADPMGSGPSQSEKTLRTNFNVYAGNGPIVFYALRDGNPVYARTANVGNNVEVVLDFVKDFKPCETILNLGEETVFYGQVLGKVASTPNYYMVGYAAASTMSRPYKLSTIAGFDSYQTNFRQAIGGTLEKSWIYDKQGDQISAAFKFPNFTCDLTNKAPASLMAAASAPFSRCIVYYRPVTSLFYNWSVTGETIESVRMASVPEEVKRECPDLNFDDMRFDELYVEPAPGNSYQKSLTDQFSGILPGNREITWYTVRFIE